MRATGPGQSAQLLVHAVTVLKEMKIPYVVVGALAVSFHGVPRSTNDADAAIWLQGTGKTEGDLTNRLKDEGFQVDLRHGDLEDPLIGVAVVQDLYNNRLDLILGIRGLDADAVRRAIAAPMLGASLNIIAAEDLIPMKISAGGVRDLVDAKGILQVSGQRLDHKLMQSLALGYGVEVQRKLAELLK